MQTIHQLPVRFSTIPPETEVDQNLCPRVVAGIGSWILYERSGGNVYCVGSIEQDKYIAVPESKVGMILEIITFLDGQHSIGMIQNHFLREYHQQVDVAHVYRLLSKANLIIDPKPTQIFRGEFKRFSMDVIDIDIRGFIEKLQPFIRRAFTPLVLITLVFIVLGLASFQFEYLVSPDLFIVQNSYTVGYFALLLMGPALTLVHEFSHALTAAVYGAHPRHIKLALYMGLPVFYAEIAGMYTLKSEDRIKVWAAGCYCNLCVSSIILLAYRLLSVHVHPVVGQIMLKIALGSLFAIVGNLSPLMPTDGYFIMSTLMRQINIRTNAFQEFFKWVRGKDSKLRGAMLVYFLATGFIIVGALVVQVEWLIKVFYELFGGAWDVSALGPHLILVVIGLALVLRLILFFLAKTRMKASGSEQN